MILPRDFTENQVAENQPLISSLNDLTVLSKEYAEDDVIYQAKIKVKSLQQN